MKDFAKIKIILQMIMYLCQTMNLLKKLLTTYINNTYNIAKDKNVCFIWGNASVAPLFLHSSLYNP